jgi:serine phosphatase RsbU (regulator of sigma subunit)
LRKWLRTEIGLPSFVLKAGLWAVILIVSGALSVGFASTGRLDPAGLAALLASAGFYFNSERIPRQYSLPLRLYGALGVGGVLALLATFSDTMPLLLPLAALVSLSCLSIWGTLVLIERGRFTLRIFRSLCILILLGSALAASGAGDLHFSLPMRVSDSPPSFDIPMLLITLVAAFNGFRARWVHYLDLRGKLICIAGCVLAISAFQTAVDSFVGSSASFPAVGTLCHYTSFSLLVSSIVGLVLLLFSLPSARLVDRRTRELGSLQQMGSVVLESTDEAGICSRSASLCRQLTRADGAWVEIADGAGGSFIAASSCPQALAEGSPGTGLGNWVSAKYPSAKGAVIVSSVPRSFPHALAAAAGLRIGSLAVAPLDAGGVRIGMLLASKASRFGFMDESRAVFEAFATQVTAALRNARLLQAGLERERYMEELSLARSIQQGLLPSSPPSVEGLDLAGTNRASTEVGGDYFDLVCENGSSLTFTIADVAGKGAPAAILMAAVQAGLHALLTNSSDPAGIAGSLNRLLCRRSLGDRFVTFFLGMIDPVSGVFIYCNAGHDPPLLVRKNGSVEELSDGGLVLGVLEEASYEAGHGILAHGDMLVLYTDGITETPLEGEGPEFGRERLARCAAEGLGLPARQVLARILRRVGEYRGDAQQHDDLTLVVISRPLA